MASRIVTTWICDICGKEVESVHGERTVAVGRIHLEGANDISGEFDICLACKEKLSNSLKMFFKTKGQEIEEKFLSCNFSENKDLYSCSNCTFSARQDEISEYKFCPICGLGLDDRNKI